MCGLNVLWNYPHSTKVPTTNGLEIGFFEYVYVIGKIL